MGGPARSRCRRPARARRPPRPSSSGRRPADRGSRDSSGARPPAVPDVGRGGPVPGARGSGRRASDSRPRPDGPGRSSAGPGRARGAFADWPRSRSRLARVCTASTVAVPASATSTAAAAVVTAVRFRRAHRRARRENGSRQAVTGSSAIHRSTSSASARESRSGPPGSRAIAFRQTASRRRVDESGRGSAAAGNRPLLHRPQDSPGSSPANGGWPVRRQ